MTVAASNGTATAADVLSGFDTNDRRGNITRLMDAGWTREDAQVEAKFYAEAKSNGSIFARQRVKLGDLMKQGVPEVEFLPSPTLGDRLFYAFNLFILAGHKKAGKSWCMVVQAADMLRAGRPVVYIDNENGWEVFVERLLSLGVDPDLVDEKFVYVPFPAERPSLDGLRAEVEAVAEEFPGAFIVLDSLRSFMSAYKLSPNADVEVGQFLGPVMGAVKNLPADKRVTVGIIDHSNRATRDGDEYAAAGSFAKAAGVDAVYFFKREERFSETQAGQVKIVTVDDRRGRLDFERFYSVGGQGEGNAIRFTRLDAKDVGAMGRMRSRVFEFLADREGEWLPPTTIISGVPGDDKSARRALELVADTERHVHRKENPSRRGAWVYTFDPAYESAPSGLSVGGEATR